MPSPLHRGVRPPPLVTTTGLPAEPVAASGGKLAEEILHKHWATCHRAVDEPNDSDSESNRGEPFYSQLEDGNDSGSDDEEIIDWDAIEAGSSLSNWDQLGESYERDAAAIGEFP